MMMTTFWRRWLLAGSLYGIAAGIFLVVVAFSYESSDGLLKFVFWPNPEMAGAVTPGAQLAIAVTGALTAGVGIIALLLRPDAKREPAADLRAGRALFFGLLFWFLIDSSFSLWIGGIINIAGNLTALLALLPPSFVLMQSARNQPRKNEVA